MFIRLKQELIITSYKTIDGRGSDNNFTPDTGMQVTIAFNHFGQGLVQRMPRCRRGYIHVVNNDFTSLYLFSFDTSEVAAVIFTENLKRLYVTMKEGLHFRNHKLRSQRDQAW